MRARLFPLAIGVAGLALVGLGSCVEPYVPAVLDAPTKLLVVDGFINGNGRTRVRLSRTANIATAAALPMEKGAKLFVVDDTGVQYPLSEKAAGFYLSDSLLLPTSRRYQLRINTTGNVNYASDLVPLKVTPPIDNLNLQVNGTQVQLQLSTHDPSNQSRYYRWSFIETWEFHSAYNSEIEYDPIQKIITRRAIPIYTCWRTEQPSTIKQTSSAKLNQDVLIDEPILQLSGRSERLQIRYSVLVSQAVETSEEFAYLELLRKNTEAVGTVNDPLPTQLTGNVHRIDGSEPVLGFVSAHTVQQKRFFIARNDLPAQTTAQFDSPYADCIMGAEDLCDRLTGCIPYPTTRVYDSPGTLPIQIIASPLTNLYPGGYSGGSPECVDCRLRGSSTKPIFW